VAARGGRAVRIAPGTVPDRRGNSAEVLSKEDFKVARSTLAQGSPSPSPEHRTETHLGVTASSGVIRYGASPGVDKRGIALSRWPLLRGDCIAPLPEKQVQPILHRSTAPVHELNRYGGTLEVLLYLYLDGSSGAASEYAMRRQLHPAQKALKNSLRNLLRMGLIECEPQAKFPFARVYRLTQRGRAVAESPIASWSQILEG
jgi:DNA-binding HxlR family transcriptional regulator